MNVEINKGRHKLENILLIRERRRGIWKSEIIRKPGEHEVSNTSDKKIQEEKIVIRER